MYKIGELSRLCRIPVNTLRYYDSEGLLTPDEIDKFTGYRYYSAARLSDCNRIAALKELDFSLAEIRAYLSAGSAEDLRGLLKAKRAELEAVLELTRARLKRLNAINQSIEEGERKMFDITIKSSDSIRVAAARKIYASREDALSEIGRIKAELPKGSVGKRTVMINYETEYRERDFDLAACVEINGALPEGCGCTDKTISLTGDIAVAVCGSGELNDAYAAMTKELERRPAQITGAFYEIYHDDGTVELKVPIRLLSEKRDMHRDDNIALPFVNDEDAIGKWKFLDNVPSEEQFCYGHPKSLQGVFLKDLYFLPDGDWFWVICGWTRGYIFTSHEGENGYSYALRYRIKELDGRKLMFVEMKHYWSESRGGLPVIWVYEKCDSKRYARKDIRIRDDTDYPFTADEMVVGNWTACDIVREDGDFATGKKNFPGELYVKGVEFLPDGSCLHTTARNTRSIAWTKGLVLDRDAETASAYELKVLDGKEYLFVEWKSGDYTFGGRKPAKYVFVRA